MKNKVLLLGVTLIAGIFLGWLLFHSSQKATEKQNNNIVDPIQVG